MVLTIPVKSLSVQQTACVRQIGDIRLFIAYRSSMNMQTYSETAITINARERQAAQANGKTRGDSDSEQVKLIRAVGARCLS